LALEKVSAEPDTEPPAFEQEPIKFEETPNGTGAAAATATTNVLVEDSTSEDKDLVVDKLSIK
jgi:hypothetical protein